MEDIWLIASIVIIFGLLISSYYLLMPLATNKPPLPNKPPQNIINIPAVREVFSNGTAIETATPMPHVNGTQCLQWTEEQYANTTMCRDGQCQTFYNQSVPGDCYVAKEGYNCTYENPYNVRWCRQWS